jgi:hypothetical protein
VYSTVLVIGNSATGNAGDLCQLPSVQLPQEQR